MGYNLVVMLAIYNILEHSLCSILRFLRAYQLALCTPKMLYMIGGDLVSDASTVTCCTLASFIRVTCECCVAIYCAIIVFSRGRLLVISARYAVSSLKYRKWTSQDADSADAGQNVCV